MWFLAATGPCPKGPKKYTTRGCLTRAVGLRVRPVEARPRPGETYWEGPGHGWARAQHLRVPVPPLSSPDATVSINC